MKTRSTPEEPGNIAASVKARQRAQRHQFEDGATVSTMSTDGSAAGLISSGLTAGGMVMVPGMGGVVLPGAGGVGNDPENGGGGHADGRKIEKKRVVGRRRPAKPFWSFAEKRLFFQGLRLYGKNFSEISRFIRIRCHQLEVHGKTKEQVRFFYHRTWQAIRAYLHLNDEVSNLANELYGLINYSVVRTRIKKRFNARLGEKLNELVQTGTTFVRHNGKRYILRTPICPALKRLNNMRAPTQEYLLPDTVMLELVPRNQASLLRVQAAEQNPRVRLQVTINRQLADVITHVETKWMTAAQRVREVLNLPPLDPPRLHIRLVADSPIDGALTVQEVARTRSVDVALKAYQERLQQKDGQTTSDDESSVRLDLKEIGQEMKDGVDFEGARDIKLLVLYIALGCPECIRFEYDYLTAADRESMQSSVGNALRRLLHLSVNDAFEHKKKKATKDALEEEITRLRSELDSIKAEMAQQTNSKSSGVSGGGATCSTGGGAEYTEGNGETGGPEEGGEAEDMEMVARENEHVNQEKEMHQLASLSNTPIVVQRQLQVGGPLVHNSLASLKAFNTNRSRLRQRACVQNLPPPGPPQLHCQAQPLRRVPPQLVTRATYAATNIPSSTHQYQTASSSEFKVAPSTAVKTSPVSDRSILDQAYKFAVLGEASTDSLSAFLNHLSSSSSSPGPGSTSQQDSEGVIGVDHLHKRDCNSFQMDLSNDANAPIESGLTTPQHAGASPHQLSSDGYSLNFTSLLSNSPLKLGSRFGSTTPDNGSRDSYNTMVSQQVTNMMNDDSTDMIANFSDLANHINDFFPAV